MKKIYLIRHGKPDFPGGQRMCLGRTDLPLGKEGFSQAARAAEMLEGMELTVFSSPLIRAVQTAEALRRPITVINGLQELYAGEWDGLTFQEIQSRYPALYAARASDKTIPLPGAEPNEVGLLRFTTALKAAVESSPGDLAVVAHGGVIGLFIQSIEGCWRKPCYGQILVFCYDNGKFKFMEDDF